MNKHHNLDHFPEAHLPHADADILRAAIGVQIAKLEKAQQFMNNAPLPTAADKAGWIAFNGTGNYQHAVIASEQLVAQADALATKPSTPAPVERQPATTENQSGDPANTYSRLVEAVKPQQTTPELDLREIQDCIARHARDGIENIEAYIYAITEEEVQ